MRRDRVWEKIKGWMEKLLSSADLQFGIASTSSVEDFDRRVISQLTGSGEDGQLGMGRCDEKDWARCIGALDAYAVSAVVAGSRNSLAICDDGSLFTWGWNQRGTLGHPPETKTESSPAHVDALIGVKIVQAAIGGWHCLAVDDKGRAYAWGKNHELGQEILLEVNLRGG
ncbi:hypothetical protein TRIUR3_20158 [Triticum urartu]|uniref:E3 ubiquitin-protein ligase HERC2 n=1 Tax=Triticum urartu TaxID=4572 RepID=M8AQE1_TRIUA|nr:hypothetical protein TRIUR3_20158 [Triticum urartu]